MLFMSVKNITDIYVLISSYLIYMYLDQTEVIWPYRPWAERYPAKTAKILPVISMFILEVVTRIICQPHHWL